MDVVIHSDDLGLLEFWETRVGRTYHIAETLDDLNDVEHKIVLIDFSACSQNHPEMFRHLNAQGNKILILDRTPSFLKAKKLLGLGVKGYGNALMREHYLTAALETIDDGMVWLYPEFTTELIQQLSIKSVDDNNAFLEKLTEREREVALLLKEGFQYKTIAEKLTITARTVKAHAHHIYKKLNVKDRLELALLLK